MKKQRGITLLALVITVIIIIILSTVAINFLFGENGLITRTQQAAQMSDIENVREKLEMAKGTAVIDGKGYIDPDHYFDIIYEEGIIGDRENDVTDNGDGTYEVTTVEGYIFIITLLPTPEEAKDIDIEYSGTSEGPRIVNIKADGTTNSIIIEVDARNADGATYTYEYSISGEESWQEAEQSKNNTCTINDLIEGETYDIRVTVTTNDGSVIRGTSVHLGQLPEGTITFKSEWVGDGTASVTVNTSAEGYRLQYQINAVEDNGWIDIVNGGIVDNLTYPSTVYARIFDGTNGSEEASETLEDKTAPSVNVTSEGTTSNSVSVSASATDAQSGMKDSLIYTYSIKVTGEADSTYTTPSTADAIASNSYTFTGLTQGTNYTVKVQVNGDKADNVGTGTLSDLTTASIPSGEGDSELEEGAITFGETAWSNNKASITVNTSTSYRIEYQVNTVTEGNWTEIANGGTINNLNYNDTVYARLTDGINHGDYASASIDDKTAPSAPTISITSGTAGNNGYYKSNVTVTITGGSDAQSGANKIRYAVTGAQTIAQTDTSDGTTSTNITISAEGESTITAYTLDKAGNVSTVATQTINKDATAPSTASLTVGTVGETSIAVTARGADSTSGIYSYEFQRSTTSTTSGFTTVATKTSTSTSYSYTYSSLSDNTTYYLRVIVTDRAGNTKTSTAVTKKTESAGIPESTSYVGYYADVDGNGSVDGIIYADLAIGGSGEWNPGNNSWATSNNSGDYTIPKKSGLKKYKVEGTYNGDFGNKGIVKPNGGSGNERFYVMALDDVDKQQNGTYYCWYDAAYGQMSDYATYTSGDFGAGEQNTSKMITKWNNRGYGAQNDNSSYDDMWGLSAVQSGTWNGSSGWYVPSRGEWAAFGGELGITTSNYSSKGLSYYYWSSSQYTTNYAWCASFSLGYMDRNSVDGTTYVRLGTTF